MSSFNGAFQSFVTEKNLQDFTPININVEPKEVLPHLEYAEFNWLRGILGQNLFDDLKEKYVAQVLNSDEADLVQYCKSVVSYRALAEALPFLSIKIRNAGAVRLSGENFTASSTSDIKYLQDHLRQRSEYFEKRLSDYLCDKGNLFPLYKFSNDNNPNPNYSNGYTHLGIYLGKSFNAKKRSLYRDSENN